jgi:hypothetical protein
MQQSRFMVLTGHLNDYPLSDLVGILRHQQKTGRLLIEYSKGPAMFYFKEGELVHVQFDNLSGLQALCVAVAQPPASFNFNPLIKPTRRSIEHSLQKAVSELLGCWDENALVVEKVEPAKPVAAAVAPTLLADREPPRELPPPHQVLALTGAVRESFAKRYRPQVMLMAAAGLLLLGLSAFIGVSGGFGSKASSVPAAATAATSVTGNVTPPANSESSNPQPKNERRNEARREPAKIAAVAAGNPPKTDTTAAATAVVPQPATAALAVAPGTDGKTDDSGAARSVRVIVQVENGRVARASIGNHRPGMDAYEALALRIARQRRYPPKHGGQEVIMIKVDQPE